jgi:hypothetical protein
MNAYNETEPLPWYPQTFRRDHEQEIFGALMAGASGGRRRPSTAESVALIRNALSLHLRSRTRRPPRSVRVGVRLMLLGAVLQLAGWIVYLMTAGNVEATAARHAAQAPAILGHLTTVETLAPVGVGVWLWMAWANARGHNWARGVFAAFFGAMTWSLLLLLVLDGPVYSPADLAATATLWCVQLVVTVLIFSKGSSSFYRNQPLNGNAPAIR